MSDPATERAEADALIEHARSLENEEALSVYDEVVARFGDCSAVEVRERVAKALFKKGHALDKLDRHEEEIQAYDELLQRCGGTQDPETLVHVAWALYSKAVTLHENLDREEEAGAAYREVVDRFRDSDDPEIRPWVSWSLWWLYRLGSCSEEETCRELVERGDDELDPDLCEYVLFAYCILGSLADQASDPQTALRIFDELVARADEPEDSGERAQVNNALIQKAYVLDRIGEYEQAIAVYHELIPRLEENEQTAQALDSRRLRAVACDDAGRPDDALLGYDDALALVDANDPAHRQQAFRLLTSKARTLRGLKRREEALIVLTSAVEAYRKPHVDAAAELRAQAVRALIEKLELLCQLERSSEATDVECELVVLLGDGRTPAVVQPAPKPPDAEVAALLAEIHASECWALFESPPTDRATQFEATALELYRRTDALLQPPIDDWENPAVAAVTIIRQVADGFALLSESLGSRRLALPQRRLLEWAIRLGGLDEWAEELGYPLNLEEDSEDIQELLDEQPEPEEDFTDDCAAACVAALYKRDLLARRCSATRRRDSRHCTAPRTECSRRTT